MVRIGITGARDGVSQDAITILDAFLNTITIEEVHHGDCIGADAIIHKIMTQRHIPITIHPPIVCTYRAYCSSNKILPPKDYLVRNKVIVNNTDVLLAFPSTKTEVYRSGTWSTIRYARKCNKQIIIFYPDGTWST